MAYLPELHYCCVCKEYLGHDNGDGICPECDIDEDEEPEYHYETDTEKLADRGIKQSDFI
jgi:hypothetical protein